MKPKSSKERKLTPRQQQLNEIIFGWDSQEGKMFDIILLIIILLSIALVMLESVPAYTDKYHNLFVGGEWAITLFFTIEYGLRLYCSERPKRYATSFFGIVDFVSILPTYLSLFITGTHYLAIIRSLRLLRAFKIFELTKYTSEGFLLLVSLRKSFAKIIVFLAFVLIFTSIIGAVMFVVEGSVPGSKFDSIPRSVYFAIVTLTTVGYGDIVPVTPFGEFLAAVVMILGYAVIAVPTGIVSADMVRDSMIAEEEKPSKKRRCQFCNAAGHHLSADYCHRCGEGLNS